MPKVSKGECWRFGHLRADGDGRGAATVTTTEVVEGEMFRDEMFRGLQFGELKQ